MTHERASFDFSMRPFLVIWETTKACPLACIHCRAEADLIPDEGELNHDEALKLVWEVKQMGTPILVFSGGDPLRRTDLFDLIDYASSLKIRTGAIPAVSESLTLKTISELKESGLSQIAFSLDSADEEVHDSFRKAKGTFKRTLESVRIANELGLNVQINSLVNIHNQESLEKLIKLVERLGIVFWEVFFLVPTGRGKELPVLSAEKFEEAFRKIYELNKRVSFIIKVTEAPHYRRFYIEQEMKNKGIKEDWSGFQKPDLPSYLRRKSGPHGGIGHAPEGVNSGKGFIFVSRRGEVMPSGFLPIPVGNIRQNSLKEIYCESPVLKELRNPSLLKGRCGVCSYRDLCGGSRSRAYALTGDYLAEDPSCAYQPSCLSQGRNN